ncbi:hypothetical protein SNE40_005302 [Patella caerulea]|uniref:Uncharacterized protein n=1 Tax=Patella caerulea TaxID=87958 RepID=A0AAN8K0L6_PATCE
MRALIFVFLLSAVSATFFPGQSNICDSFKRKGICLFTDLLDIYIANNYKKQIYSCCTFSDNFAKVFARTKNGKEFLKLPGSYLKPIDFDTCNIAGDGICPKCCLVKGEWTQWSQFSGCSATCDGGKKIRVRECKLPASSSGVPTCEGDAVETMSCGETPCLETKCNAAGYTYDATIMVCIKIFGNPLLNFFGAKKKCESEGGRLYIADTTAKIGFLKTVIGDSCK